MRTTANTAFSVARLEDGYEVLDQCPPSLIGDVVTFPHGDLVERVRGVRAWHDALMEGSLPTTDVWAPMELAAPARKALQELGILRFCKGEPQLVDDLMKQVITSFQQAHGVFEAEVGRQLAELERLERERRIVESQSRSKGTKARAQTFQLSDEDVHRLLEQAIRSAKELERVSDSTIVTSWSETVRLWSAVSDTFGDLGNLMGRGFDLSRSILKHVGWGEIVRLRDLVSRMPQLQEVIRSLGRLQQTTTDESVAEQLFVPVRRLEEERRNVPTPLVPSETRGIERGDAISRMLPSEAVMLGHPKLRMLWHARRSERALLTYRVEGLEVERILVEREVLEQQDRKRAKLERGPIVAVIDTSGSMHGIPETVAKALVLEALRTAHAENRRCYLFAYSGSGDVVEHELSLTDTGLGRLLDFLSFSFGGGTDIGVMHAVTKHLERPDWIKADVLVVSDGEFPVPEGVRSGCKQARDKGTRFHAVQIGNIGSTGLHAFCDPVHVFSDWQALRG